MTNFTIKNATAIYTGGGIYIYYGELENGSYFRTADEWEHIAICDKDTSIEDADYPEFYEEHEIDCISGHDFDEYFNSIISWILNNKPDGNYQAYELEDRMLRFMEAPTIEIEDAQTLAKSIQDRTKQEHFEKMLNAQIRSISNSMAEYKNGVRFIFDDSDYYRRDFEKQWKSEFYTSAVRLFTNKGYKIIKQGNYNMITW